MESKERLASQKRRVSTPSPMPAKQKRELGESGTRSWRSQKQECAIGDFRSLANPPSLYAEALNNIIPVTNIDTGEAVDLKFLEELTEQVRMRIDDRPLTITSLFLDSRFSLRMQT
jgi:hypothetical protein